ncbi:MAG: hypothetical protein KatS3mg083_612 [Candidatus Dojkabacteria bacterium]|nr:MAG: hypothetical protein KatS3mg083_612 [Candidatus Dojkabacteria bacterium]
MTNIWVMNKRWCLAAAISTAVLMLALLIRAYEVQYTLKDWLLIVIPLLLLGGLNAGFFLYKYFKVKEAEELLGDYFYRLRVVERLNEYWKKNDMRINSLLMAYQYQKEYLEMRGLLNEQKMKELLEELDRNIESDMDLDDAETLALWWFNIYTDTKRCGPVSRVLE